VKDFTTEQRAALPRCYYDAAADVCAEIKDRFNDFSPGEESIIHFGCVIWDAVEGVAWDDRIARFGLIYLDGDEK
jgi:hypothetical protein